jgi:FAD/FMN-containing dehydrogenase
VVPSPGSALSSHSSAVERLLTSYRSIPADAPVRLAKSTSNLFRARSKGDVPGLDTSGLTNVISIDPDACTADVAGMCTYGNLVAATLRYGFAPLVIPQSKTLTLGGAITGLGVESASFRCGLPHESVLEMDILTGAGELVTASPETHRDLFRAFPNSHGTLGYPIRLKIQLESVAPFVALRHLRFHSLAEMIARMERIIDTGGLDDVPVDYLDGVVFSADESYLCVGRRTTTAGPVSDYSGKHSYYESIQHDAGSKEDRLTISDYFWRWNSDSRAPRWRPRRYLRSSVKSGSAGSPTHEPVAEDVEVPIERTVEFLDWFLQTVPTSPISLCPLRLRDHDGWPLHPMEPDRSYVNIGFWCAKPLDVTEGTTDPPVGEKVAALDGHKSAHSEPGELYQAVRKTYDPDSRLLDLYAEGIEQRPLSTRQP